MRPSTRGASIQGGVKAPDPIAASSPTQQMRPRVLSLEPMQKADLCRSFFATIDVDNDGGVSVVEFVKALKGANNRVKEAGLGMHAMAPIQMFMEIDDVSNGTISVNEFVESMSAANDFASLFVLFGDSSSPLYEHYTQKALLASVEQKERRAARDARVHRASVWDVGVVKTPGGTLKPRREVSFADDGEGSSGAGSTGTVMEAEEAAIKIAALEEKVQQLAQALADAKGDQAFASGAEASPDKQAVRMSEELAKALRIIEEQRVEIDRLNGLIELFHTVPCITPEGLLVSHTSVVP